MIKYSLECTKGHTFDSWFRSGAAFDTMSKRGQIDCPECGSTKVSKALMAPRVATASKRSSSGDGETIEAPTPVPQPSPEGMKRMAMQREIMAMMRKVRAEVEAKAEYVGPKFADEARKIHYEETPARGIYGEASAADVKALHEEGVECYPLPVLPEDRN